MQNPKNSRKPSSATPGSKKTDNTAGVAESTVVLPCGITGFRSTKDRCGSAPKHDLRISSKSFRNHCFTAARQLGGSVVPMEAGNSFYASFSFFVLELHKNRVAIVLNNNVYPMVAFAEPHDIEAIYSGHSDGCSTLLEFVEVPELEDIFRSFGEYTVLTTSQLRQPISHEMCKQLSTADLHNIEYWKPDILGHLVFQYWD